MNNNLLYQNALFFKEEILPYTFVLELKNELMIIAADEKDFAHLVGKQYSKNLNISSVEQKDFFQKVLSSNITYEDLIQFDTTIYSNEYNWIKNKNISFISAFNSFNNEVNLKIYKTINNEIYTKLNIDYFHQKNTLNENIIILGIIGCSYKDSFTFNTILSNDSSLKERFQKFKKVKVLKVYKILNKDLNKKLKSFDKIIKKSPKNVQVTKNKQKPSPKNYLTNNDIKTINNMLIEFLKISRGANGKKSLKITKNNKTIESGLKLNLNNFNSLEEIAEYINKTYK